MIRKFFSIGIFLILLCIPVALAVDSGPNSPGTTGDDSSVGTITWSTTSNAAAQDDTYSTAALNDNGETSHYLTATNFGFSIPTDATIDGITVEVDKYNQNDSAADVTDSAVRIIKGGTIGSTDRSAGGNWAGSDTDSYTSYGGAADLWGETWTPSDINASTFGFAISAVSSCALCFGGPTITASVDHIRITVHYTAASSSITGRVRYQTGGVLPGVTVAVSLNGAAAAATDAVDAGGEFTITGLTLTGGTIVTLYIDGDATADAVTVSTGSGGNMTGMLLVKDQLIVRSGTGTHTSIGSPITSSMLDTANNNGDTDITAIYTNSSQNITVITGKKLWIETGSTLTLGGTLTVGTTGTTSELHLEGNLMQNDNAITVNGPYTQSGGTFTGSSGGSAMTVVRYSLDGGRFISTTGILTVGNGVTFGGSWTQSAGGTFTHNNGTVQSNAHSVTWDVPTSVNFYNFEHDALGTGTNSTSAMTIQTGDTIVVEHTFTHTDGAILTGTIEARGNVVVGANTSGDAQATGTLSFLVSGDQTITGNGGATLALNVAKSSGTLSAGSTNLTIEDFTLSSGTFVSTTGTLTIGGINTGGNWTHTAGGTFAHNGGTVKLCGAGTVDVASSETFYNLESDTKCATDSGIGTTIASGDRIVVQHTFTHTDGTLSTGTVEVRGNTVINTGANGGNSPMQFTGTGTQLLTRQGTVTTGRWTIAKPSGIVSLSGSLTLNTSGQDLIMTGGTLDLNGFNLTVNDVFTIGTGTTLRLTGDETISTPDHIQKDSTIWYDAAGSTRNLKDYTYQHLLVSSTGSAVYHLPAATLDVNGNMTFSGSTLAVTNGNTITVSGSWLKYNGTFTSGTGTVTLDGRNQTMTGSTSFYNLTKSTSTAETLTFAATTTQTITNTLTLNGAVSNLLSLRSSQTGTQWRIDPQGSRSVDYVDVKDSNNIHATPILPTNSVDSGNTINWFAQAVQEITEGILQFIYSF